MVLSSCFQEIFLVVCLWSTLQSWPVMQVPQGARKEELLLSIIAIIAIIIIIILSLKFQQLIFPESSSSHFLSARC